MHDLYRTREAIEVAAVYASAGNDRVALEEVARVVADAEQAAAWSEWKAVATLDIVFHQRIVELIGSDLRGFKIPVWWAAPALALAVALV